MRGRCRETPRASRFRPVVGRRRGRTELERRPREGVEERPQGARVVVPMRRLVQRRRPPRRSGRSDGAVIVGDVDARSQSDASRHNVTSTPMQRPLSPFAPAMASGARTSTFLPRLQTTRAPIRAASRSCRGRCWRRSLRAAAGPSAQGLAGWNSDSCRSGTRSMLVGGRVRPVCEPRTLDSRQQGRPLLRATAQDCDPRKAHGCDRRDYATRRRSYGEGAVLRGGTAADAPRRVRSRLRRQVELGDSTGDRPRATTGRGRRPSASVPARALQRREEKPPAAERASAASPTRARVERLGSGMIRRRQATSARGVEQVRSDARVCHRHLPRA